jgi:hypothetical protein
MNRVFALLLFVACIAATPAPPQNVMRFKTSAGSYNLLDGVALNAAAASRTITLTLNWSFSGVIISYQATRDAYTDVTVTCTESLTYPVILASPVTRNCSSGTCERAPIIDVETSSVSHNQTLRYSTEGVFQIVCVFSGTSAGASDLITVQANAFVGR